MMHALVEKTLWSLACVCLLSIFNCSREGCLGLPEAETEEGRLQRACDDEDAPSCTDLAKRLDGTAKHGHVWERVLLLYARGCEHGDQSACAHLEKTHGTLGRECNGEKLSSCVALATMYDLGRGVMPDLDRAGELYERACDGGEPIACNSLGKIYEGGDGRRPDYERAAKLYTQACESKVEAGCANLGRLHHLGRGVPQDNERALELLENACKRGSYVGCHSLGLIYFEGEGITRDPEREKAIFDESCKAGLLPSCRWFAYLFQDTDSDRAARIYLKACDSGDGQSCTMLSLLLSGGDRGLYTPERRADLLLKRGCNQGWPSSCLLMTKKLYGTVADRQKIDEYRYRYCRYGDVESCVTDGRTVEHGVHGWVSDEMTVEPNPERARDYYEVACGWRRPSGCAHLSVMYREGRGVPRDLAKAKAFLRLASRWEGGYGCEIGEDGCCVVTRTPLPPNDETKGIPGRWVLVPAGSFTMYEPVHTEEGDTYRHSEVTLTRDFHMQNTEVTQAQFLDLMGYNPSRFTECGESCPVESVSWHEAAAYANKLSERVGTKACYTCAGKSQSVKCERNRSYSSPYECPGYRLPTEAEWERAARAGTKGPSYAGAIAEVEQHHAPTLDPIAWYAGSSMVNDEKAPHCPRLVGPGLDMLERERCSPHPVGKLCANPWSLRDMLGNVAEWCDDPSDPVTPERSPIDPSRPLGSYSHYIVRGGGWSSGPGETCAGRRGSRMPSEQENYIGFRPVRSVLKAPEGESP